ncbi:hypothetical protein [Streptomyces tauricus]|uniref:hypothetical protein n=1 Tax=Streptomyces tauricus TaxID=68274 RepID=UPI0037F6ABD4
MRTGQEWTVAVRLLWRGGPPYTAALALTVVCGALTGPLIVVGTGRLVGALPGAVTAGAGSQEARRALVALAVFGALTLVRTALRALESGLAAVLRLRAAGVVEFRKVGRFVADPAHGGCVSFVVRYRSCLVRRSVSGTGARNVRPRTRGPEFEGSGTKPLGGTPRMPQ